MAVQHRILNNKSLQSIHTILGTTYHGAYQEYTKSDAFQVIHAGAGQFYSSCPKISSFFQECDLTGEYLTEEEMKIVLWKKLAANCAINPLTAIQQCLNGELISSKT